MSNIKKNIKTILGYILVAFFSAAIATGTTIYASGILAGSIEYTNTKSVGAALDDLYNLKTTNVQSLIDNSLQNYVTKDELKAHNTTWTEIASTNSKDWQSKTINLDQYNEIAVEFNWGGNSAQVSRFSVSKFKTYNSTSNAAWAGYDDYGYFENEHRSSSVWVTTYYSNGILYYKVHANQYNNTTSIYCKVYGIK